MAAGGGGAKFIRAATREIARGGDEFARRRELHLLTFAERTRGMLPSIGDSPGSPLPAIMVAEVDTLSLTAMSTKGHEVLD